MKKMKKSLCLLLTIITIAAILGGCTSNDTGKEAEPANRLEAIIQRGYIEVAEYSSSLVP